MRVRQYTDKKSFKKWLIGKSLTAKPATKGTARNSAFLLSAGFLPLVLAAGAMLSIQVVAQEAPTPGEDDIEEGLEAEEVVVIGDRSGEQRLQNIPIAISAFDEDALERQNIRTASDIQFNVPNLHLTRTNFTGPSISIRGIGNLCVGTTCQASTGVHINSASAPSARIFETEFFDVERIEVLRGPQGTAFGRNTTGGILNIITAKPDETEASYQVRAEVTSFNGVKGSAVINTPFGKSGIGANRLAVYFHRRDGFTDNSYANEPGADNPLNPDEGIEEDIDDRDIQAFRNTMKFNIGDNAELLIMLSRFEEDDRRTRVSKQLCTKDTESVLGCVGAGFDNSNTAYTLFALWTSDWAGGIPVGNSAIPFIGLYRFGTDGSSGRNPNNLRSVYSDVNPVYYALEDVANIEFTYRFANYELTALYLRTEFEFYGITDYDWDVQKPFNGPGNTNPLAAVGQPVTIDNGAAQTLRTTVGADPTAPVARPQSLARQITTNRAYGYDESNTVGTDQSFELRLASRLEGMVNFQIGTNFGEGEGDTHYLVHYNGLTAFAEYGLARAGAFAADNNLATLAARGAELGKNARYFDSYAETKITYSSLFGEVYLDLGAKSKLTFGLRFTDESVQDRTPYTGDIADRNQSSSLGVVTGFFCCVQREVSDEVSTGRVIFDHQFNSRILGYASLSTGYKSGGYNAVRNVTDSGLVGETFEPETVTTFEFGAKMRFKNNRMQLNWAAFVSEFENLQISRIVDRSSENLNIDAEISGLEAEFIWLPGDNFRMDASLALLSTEVQEYSAVDPANPLGDNLGNSNYRLCKDLAQAYFYVVESPSGSPSCSIIDSAAYRAAAGQAITGALAQGAITAAQAAQLRGALTLRSPDPTRTGYYQANSSVAGLVNQALGSTVPSLVQNYQVDGYAQDLSGNKLPNAPDFSIRVGAQYTWNICGDKCTVVTLRGDVYYQGEFYSRVYNLDRQDEIDAWEQVNLSLQIVPRDDRFQISIYITNALDEDYVTGHYLTDATSGNFINAFVLEPRVIGASFKANF